MNRYEADIMNVILTEGYASQRALSENTGLSVGVVNRAVNELVKQGLLDGDFNPTSAARLEAENKSPERAVILAAGYGMRMAPINTQSPKALIEANGEVMIERTIRQLHEAGIKEIYVVVGFMKEQFEYLMDEYGVELIVNRDYDKKNNLHSLALAAKHLSNCYIVPCDVMCRNNPFRKHELYSWYMVSDAADADSYVRVNRKLELVPAAKNFGGNAMIGIAYITDGQGEELKRRLTEYDRSERHKDDFWEEALNCGDKWALQARVERAENVVEINSYEQLRELDEYSANLKSDAMAVIAERLNADQKEIKDIVPLKKGMTNRSFSFTCRGKKYIMRIPGEGTGKLINRENEAVTYQTIKGRNICDEIIYINPANGYKITEFINNARVCDAENADDLRVCMKKLRDFHSLNLQTGHEFDIFERIDFYESLWDGAASVYRDYDRTKKNVFSLRPFIEKNVENRCLTHIDAVPDNFLFTDDSVRLIDWEYAGMQDPHVDIAMFCIYALYNREQTDRLIDIYFEGHCPENIRLKIYCYIAACGLLWSNWCEYKRNLGVDFGEYSLRQYRYAKDYYKIIREEGGIIEGR